MSFMWLLGLAWRGAAGLEGLKVVCLQDPKVDILAI